MNSPFPLPPLPRRLSVTIMLGAALLSRLPGAETPAASGAAQPGPTRSYTDQGTTTTSYTVTNDFGSYYNSFPGRFGGNYGFNQIHSGTVTTQYRPIYFPPRIPALGEPIPPNTTRASLAKFSPPNVLAAYVYEPFYAPLSPLLFTEDLARRRREKLDGYRAARSSALAALHARLDTLQTADADVRARELAAFATEQSAALEALEATAEELRANFVNGGFFQAGSDWNQTRQWRLGDDTRWESTTDEIKVMTAAAFFQDGLSPAQRRLLRELAMELTDSLQAPGADISLAAPGPFFYFAPEMARIRLPVDLPPALAAKISSYREAKSALKAELREVLYKQDRAFFDFTRVNALKALAEQQASRLAALELQAEEIRVGLAPLPNPASPPALPLPADLARRISTYLTQKSEWQRTMLARLEALRTEFPQDRVEYVRQGDGLVIQIVANRRSSDETKAKRAAAQTALAAFNTEQGRSYAVLVRDKEILRAEVMKVVSNAAGPAANRSIDQLLALFAYAFNQQERWERYHDYEFAVLQPGLSAAQRRLLFGAAVEKLDLPPDSRF